MKKKSNPPVVPVDPRSKRQRLARIESDPSQWQVCEGCETVLSVRAVLCPRCHAYRFDLDSARVVATARRIARRCEEPLPEL